MLKQPQKGLWDYDEGLLRIWEMEFSEALTWEVDGRNGPDSSRGVQEESGLPNLWGPVRNLKVG